MIAVMIAITTDDASTRDFSFYCRVKKHTINVLLHCLTSSREEAARSFQLSVKLLTTPDRITLSTYC